LRGSNFISVRAWPPQRAGPEAHRGTSDPDQVAKGGLEKLAEIPYFNNAKAESIVAVPRTSVPSQTDEETGLTLSLIAEHRLPFEKRIDRLKDRLWDRIKEQQAPHLLKSIAGSEKWGATGLYW
jgi:hypothetical protein